MSTTAPTIDPTPTITNIAEHVTITIEAWHDPIVEAAPGAVRTDTDDALVWNTPAIGTIGMVMAHRFARHATDGPSLWTVEDIALTFGIGNSAARVWRSLDRLERFGIIRRTGDRIAVRLWLAPLTQRQPASSSASGPTSVDRSTIRPTDLVDVDLG